MSLTKFTLNEQRKIQLALDLSSDQLEEGSYLYQKLNQLELDDERLGLDRSNCVKSLAEDITEIQDKIEAAYLNVNFGVEVLDIRVKQDVRKRVEYKENTSAVTGLQNLKRRKKIELKKELRWINRNSICLG